MHPRTPTPVPTGYDWRETAAGALACIGIAFVMLLAGTIVALSTSSPAHGAPRFAPDARTRGSVCADHDTTRWHVRLNNRRSTRAVHYTITTIRGERVAHRFVRVPAGRVRHRSVPVDRGHRARVIVRALDTTLADRAVWGRFCRFDAHLGRTNAHQAAPLRLTNRLPHGRRFTVETDARTGGRIAWRVHVPARSRRTVMVGIDPAGTHVRVTRGHHKLLTTTRR